MAAGVLHASPPERVPPPPVPAPSLEKLPVIADVSFGECEPFTQDDTVQVERLADGGLRVSQCLVGYGEWIPKDEVRVLKHGDRLRISFLDHSRPYERDDAIPACSSTRRLVVTVAAPYAKVASVSVEGWRVQAAGTSSASVLVE